MMKGIVKYQPDPGFVELRTNLPEPVPGPGQVKVRVTHAGICASDLHYLYRGSPRLKPPVVLGHEAAGVVAEVGAGVTKVKPGDRVALQTTYHVCGSCEYCLQGAYNLCSERVGMGSKANGGFAEYLVTRQQSVMIVADHLSLAEASLLEPFACGVHGVLERATMFVDALVVVLGPGPIGIGAAQAAQAAGARVVMAGLSSDEHRLELCRREFGMEVAAVDQVDLIKAVREMSRDGEGADFVVEASGSAKALASAIDMCRKRGTVIQLGVFPGEAPVAMDKVLLKELQITGSLSQTPMAFATTLKMLEEGKLKAKPLITHLLPLEEWEKAFKLTEDRIGIKVLLTPTAE